MGNKTLAKEKSFYTLKSLLDSDYDGEQLIDAEIAANIDYSSDVVADRRAMLVVNFPVKTSIALIDGPPSSGKSTHTSIICPYYYSDSNIADTLEEKRSVISLNKKNMRDGVRRLSQCSAEELELYALGAYYSDLNRTTTKHSKRKILSEIVASAKDEAVAPTLEHRIIVSFVEINNYFNLISQAFNGLIASMSTSSAITLINGGGPPKIHIFSEGRDDPIKAPFEISLTMVPIEDTWFFKMTFFVKRCEVFNVSADDIHKFVASLKSEHVVFNDLKDASDENIVEYNMFILYPRAWTILALCLNSCIILSSYMPGVILAPEIRDSGNIGTLPKGMPGDTIFKYSTLRTLAAKLKSSIIIENLDLYDDQGERMKGANVNYTMLKPVMAGSFDSTSGANMASSNIGFIRFRDGSIPKGDIIYIQDMYMICTALKTEATFRMNVHRNILLELIDYITRRVRNYYTIFESFSGVEKDILVHTHIQITYGVIERLCDEMEITSFEFAAQHDIMNIAANRLVDKIQGIYDGTN